MTLTPEQKIEAYTYAMLVVLDAREHSEYPWVCSALGDWLEGNIEDGYLIRFSFLQFFPEFKDQRPSRQWGACSWWDPTRTAPRLRALEKAIQLVKNSIP